MCVPINIEQIAVHFYLIDSLGICLIDPYRQGEKESSEQTDNELLMN